MNYREILCYSHRGLDLRSSLIRAISPGIFRVSFSRRILLRFCLPALLTTIGLPALARANVIVNTVQIIAEASARAHHGIGPLPFRTDVEKVNRGLGDFSETVRAYQEVENPFPFGPDLAALAESQLSYTSHASPQQFSAQFNEYYRVNLNLAGGSTEALASFFYLAYFEVTTPTAFHLLTSYDGFFNTYRHRFDVTNGTRSIFDSSFDDSLPADITGVLQPGRYELTYRGGSGAVRDELIGGFDVNIGPSTFIFALDSSPANPTAVPDGGSTLALLGCGLACLIAALKLTSRVGFAPTGPGHGSLC